MAAGDQSGCESFNKDATPANTAADAELPDTILNVGNVKFPASRAGGPTGNGHAAATFTPGPTISGFKIPSFTALGPRPEKSATAGAGDAP
ncbi:hypothetical protein IEQ34_019905 [Dendrobium chrysotoxum]|uniref:Uncharacterized protein n=1 Tax=Dendrobium chrysotoxum TaxID=161865 RepID=A0AAV7G8A7_DENCH|nr:hypothetical protein IEQ34_019905 [Dendrobium chrysotoxum]